MSACGPARRKGPLNHQHAAHSARQDPLEESAAPRPRLHRSRIPGDPTPRRAWRRRRAAARSPVAPRRRRRDPHAATGDGVICDAFHRHQLFTRGAHRLRHLQRADAVEPRLLVELQQFRTHCLGIGIGDAFERLQLRRAPSHQHACEATEPARRARAAAVRRCEEDGFRDARVGLEAEHIVHRGHVERIGMHLLRRDGERRDSTARRRCRHRAVVRSRRPGCGRSEPCRGAPDRRLPDRARPRPRRGIASRVGARRASVHRSGERHATPGIALAGRPHPTPHRTTAPRSADCCPVHGSSPADACAGRSPPAGTRPRGVRLRLHRAEPIRQAAQVGGFHFPGMESRGVERERIAPAPDGKRTRCERMAITSRGIDASPRVVDSNQAIAERNTPSRGSNSHSARSSQRGVSQPAARRSHG